MPFPGFKPRREPWLLAAMLIVLHSSLAGTFGDAVSRSLMLAHFGFFLLWQPVWHRNQHLQRRSSFAFAAATIAVIFVLNLWGVFVWLLLLIGLVGGRISTDPNDRYLFLITLVFLLIELLIGVVAPLFKISLHPAGIQSLFHYGLFALPLILLFIPVDETREKQGYPVDFLNGLTISLLSGVLALGSLVIMYYQQVEYAWAVAQTLIAIAVFLLAISWLWLPHAGFGGIGQFWARNLLSIGTPFEQWLADIAQLARRQQTPRQFLHSAMRLVRNLNWVSRVEWESSQGTGSMGDYTPHRMCIEAGDIRVILHTHHHAGPTLTLHAKHLVQILAHFHRAKISEQELAQHAHMQAIYETGARVTHDIKNLLQSMHAITVAIGQDSERPDPQIHAMLRRQLPLLTQRLQSALDKLQAPARPGPPREPVSTWWRALRERNLAHKITFEARIDGDPPVPAEVLDSIVENLLENARFKRQMHPGLGIRVGLDAGRDGIRISVEDDGEPIDPSLAGSLLREPVPSRSGLGVGLYQSARAAEQAGYALRLADNRRGCVRFELATEPG